MEDAEQEMTEDEMAEKIARALTNNAPIPDDKQTVHTFLHNVATAKDTTKTGYLTEEEIGLPKLPIRACKNLSLVSDAIMDNPYFAEYFMREGEIVTSTSLSRNAKLLSLAVLQKREIADVTKKKTENSGWFKKKKPNGEVTEGLS